MCKTPPPPPTLPPPSSVTGVYTVHLHHRLLMDQVDPRILVRWYATHALPCTIKGHASCSSTILVKPCSHDSVVSRVASSWTRLQTVHKPFVNPLQTLIKTIVSCYKFCLCEIARQRSLLLYIMWYGPILNHTYITIIDSFVQRNLVTCRLPVGYTLVYIRLHA